MQFFHFLCKLSGSLLSLFFWVLALTLLRFPSLCLFIFFTLSGTCSRNFFPLLFFSHCNFPRHIFVLDKNTDDTLGRQSAQLWSSAVLCSFFLFHLFNLFSKWRHTPFLNFLTEKFVLPRDAFLVLCRFYYTYVFMT